MVRLRVPEKLLRRWLQDAGTKQMDIAYQWARHKAYPGPKGVRGKVGGARYSSDK